MSTGERLSGELACQTPGAQFHTMITPGAVMVRVDFPRAIGLTEDQAETIEASLHNAVELVLAPLFIPARTQEPGWPPR